MRGDRFSRVADPDAAIGDMRRARTEDRASHADGALGPPHLPRDGLGPVARWRAATGGAAKAFAGDARAHRGSHRGASTGGVFYRAFPATP